MKVPFILSTGIREYNRTELYTICRQLELEYYGGHISIDKENISSFTTDLAKKRAQQFAFHHSIVEPMIAGENTTYINPPSRIFTTKNNGKISQKVQDHITDIYEQMQFDQFMQKAEHFVALQGTVAYKPAVAVDGVMRLIEMYPSNATFKIKGDPLFPGVPMQIEYSNKINNIQIDYIWTPSEVFTKTIDAGQTVLTQEEHNFGRLPFEVMKLIADNGRVYGFPDTELASLAKHRSLVLANAMARLHLSDLEKLLITGLTLDEALKHTRERIMALPNTVEQVSGRIIQPTAQFISPDGEEALQLLKAYGMILKEIKDTRGWVQKIFSKGADVPSAESIRLGGIELYNKQQRRRKFLEQFEHGLWELIIVENNNNNKTQIPEGTQLRIDYKPDPYAFKNAKDEVIYFQSAIASKVETPISWIRNRHREYSEEEAIEHYEANKKFFEEENVETDVPDKVDEPKEEDKETT